MLQQRTAKIVMLILLISQALLPPWILSTIILVILCSIIANPLGNRNNMGFLKFVWPLVLIFFIGLRGILYHNFYNVLKDAWYIIYPTATLITGYLLMIYIVEIKSLFKLIVIAASAIAALHLMKFLIDPDILHQSYKDIRNSSAGRGYLIVPMAFSVLIVCRNNNILDLYRKNNLLLVGIFSLLSISLVLSFSRTLYATTIILLCILLGIAKKSNIKVFFLSFLLLLMIITASLFVDGKLQSVDGYENTFISKSIRSLKEVTARSYNTKKDIAFNWRGYETYMGLQAYSSGNNIDLVFGKGLGVLTDMGIFIKLGEEEFRYIPIFHNGYVYLLVKTGFVGVVLYIVFLFRMICFARPTNRLCKSDIVIVCRMTVGLIAVLLFTTYVIGGFFNKAALSSVILVMGACLSYLYSQKRRSLSVSSR